MPESVHGAPVTVEEANEARRKQMRVGEDRSLTYQRQAKVAAKQKEIDELRNRIKPLLSKYMPGADQGSVLGKLQHLNDLNEIGISTVAILTMIEYCLKMVTSTEYYVVQKRAYENAGDNQYKKGMTIYRCNDDGSLIADADGNPIVIEGPAYGEYGSKITRRDVILNGMMPPPNRLDAFIDEMNQMSNALTGMGIETSHDVLDRVMKDHMADRQKNHGRDMADSQAALAAATRAAAAKPGGPQ